MKKYNEPDIFETPCDIMSGDREVVCADSNIWMVDRRFKIIITSLPDMEEVGMNLEDWQEWMKLTCRNLINSLEPESIIFFYQTDRKYKGKIIDKKTLISQIFLEQGFNNILSKIVLKVPANKTVLFRPSYTNLFAFSKKITSGKPTPDVIDAGQMVYKNAMGFNAVKCCVDFLNKKGIKGTVVDPFCGSGSVLKITNDLGFDAVGVDILPEQVNFAQKL